MKLKHELSRIDRIILKDLLSPQVKRTSVSSGKFDVPVTTIQRSRKRLEKEFLESYYSLNLDKFGWRRVDFFIATISGKTDDVAKELLAFREVTFVGKSIGQRMIDLRVETIVKDKGEILDLMERIKGMEGIKDASWSEIVMVMRMKMSVPSYVIDRL